MQNQPKKPVIKFSFYWMYALVLAFLFAMYFYDKDSVEKEVSYQEFVNIIKPDTVPNRPVGVKKIVIIKNHGEAKAYLADSLAQKIFAHDRITSKSDAVVKTSLPSNETFQRKLEEWESDPAAEKNFSKVEVFWEDGGMSLANILWAFGPIVLLIAFWFFLMRRMSSRGGGGGIFNVGKSQAKMFDKDKSQKVTFADVAGLNEAKQEIEEIVEFLKNPKRYTDLGGKIPKGALLVGPPGTGKTLLAKAVAGEADVPFFSMSGADFVEMFVGVGASRVRDLFRQAKEKAPCIVFIDEIDAVGRARGKNPSMGGNDERENTLNQLLTEMDGFGSNSGVIVLAATNRADILDKALLRAGRFDRQIYVDLPELSDRVAIFKVHLRKIKIDSTVDIEQLARQTPGFSGAEIANVCNEAALIAARRNKKSVQRQDFNDAIDRIVGGLEKRSKIFTNEEKRAIAIHEAGHATVSWHLEFADPLVKVTIVPRGKALGAAWYEPEERQNTPTQVLLDKICSLLAGRASEELFLGRISTGALNDLERANKIAYAMVAYYGMSGELTNVCYYDSSGQSYGFTKPYSEERAHLIDQEVSRIISEQYLRAKEILQKYSAGVLQLAEVLITREVIFTEDVISIFGKRPWRSRNEELLLSSQSEKMPDSMPTVPTISSATESKPVDKSDETKSDDTKPDETPDAAQSESESNDDASAKPPVSMPPFNGNKK